MKLTNNPAGYYYSEGRYVYFCSDYALQIYGDYYCDRNVVKVDTEKLSLAILIASAHSETAADQLAKSLNSKISATQRAQEVADGFE